MRNSCDLILSVCEAPHPPIWSFSIVKGNLKPLFPTNIVPGREQRIHKMLPSKDRGIKRSKTYQGIADAMAEQWGRLPEGDKS